MHNLVVVIVLKSPGTVMISGLDADIFLYFQLFSGNVKLA